MFERPRSGERAVLVHVQFHQPKVQPVPFSELKELVLAAGADPVGEIYARRDAPDPKYYVGKGKLAEIAEALCFYKADVVIFNQDLSPSQEKNVEQQLRCRVLSRTGLILDIFAQRARTFEGKLQVELAQLEHIATRLVRGWTHLERQKGGIGLRGPGETQLESDRRIVRSKITVLRKRLLKVKKQRAQSRHARARAQVPTVALVGYTNAGKSTLFNALTGASVWVADQLFATLDPTLRAIELPGVGNIVLADTVGFIRQLPHTLVDAFRATLEEVCQATILLHVVDASDEKYEENIEAVNKVLAEIGADRLPQVLVFNKADQLCHDGKPGDCKRDKAGNITKLWLSALSKEGLNLLQEALQSRLVLQTVQGTLHLASEQAHIRAELYALRGVLAESVDLQVEGWDMKIKLTTLQWERLCQRNVGLRALFKIDAYK